MTVYEYVRYAPGPHMSAIVENYWSFGPLEKEQRAYSRPFAPIIDRIRIDFLPNPIVDHLLPKADIGLVFAFEKDRNKVKGVITGSVTSLGFNAFLGIDRAIGVKLRLAGSRGLLREDLIQFRDRITPLDDVWGEEAFSVINGVASQSLNGDKFALIETAIRQNQCDSDQGNIIVDAALSYFDKQGGHARVSAFCEQHDVSRRHLSRLFQSYVGVSPKLYCRIKRFHSVIATLCAGKPASWSEIAGNCGYGDQSHLIGEFKGFTGASPERFLTGELGNVPFRQYERSKAN